MCPVHPPPAGFKDLPLSRVDFVPPPMTAGNIDTNSNADSGVDDLHKYVQDSKNMETVSLISSLSTISSEEDAGVSLTFDPGSDGCKKSPADEDDIQEDTPPLGGFVNKPLSEWDISDVGGWLQSLGLGIYVNAFADNEIEGLHLPELGKDELTELGINRIGHRLTFEKSIKKFKK